MFRDRTRNHLYYQSLLGAIWLSSVAVFVIDLDDVRGSVDVLIALGVMIAISSNIEFTMSGGREPLKYSPDAQPMTLAIMLLHPVAVMALCGATLFDRFYVTHSVSWIKRAGLAGSVAIAAGGASALRHVLLPAEIPATYLLATAFVVALIYEIGSTLLQAVMYQLGVMQSGLELLRDTRRMTVISSSLAAIAVAIIWNFIDSPIALVWVFCVLQVATYAMQRLTASEAQLRSHSEYLEGVFSRYVPVQVAEEIARSGDAIMLGGEEREITVLFADLRNFTGWSEHEQPESVVSQLNEVLGAISTAIMNHEGTLDKFIGDAVMAFWNAPLDQDDHASRAIDAAREMLNRVTAVNDVRQSRGQAPFTIGVGIHTGRAIVGNIGHEARLEYTAVGDTVNTAARLETATKREGVSMLISSATFEHASAPHRSYFGQQVDIHVIGKQETIRVYPLVCELRGSVADRFSA